MSSTFGGSGSGSGNRVVYVVTVDSSGVQQGLQSAQQSFNQFNTSAQSTARNLQTFNQPLQQLEGGLQGVGTNLDTASQSFSKLDSSLQSTTPDLDAINSNWQAMDQGAQKASNSVDAVGSSFNNAKGGLTQYNTLSGEVVTNTQQMGDATQTMGDKMRGAGSFLKSNALALSLVTSGVVGLASSYTQLQKTQLASDRASLMSEKAQQRVVKAQDALNKAITKYGPNSHEAAVKTKDLQLAQEASGVAMQKAALALQTLAQQQASFVPQMIQDLVLIGGGTANMISGFKDGIPVVKGFASALKTGLAPALLAASGPVLVAVVGIYALIGALRAAQKLNELVQQKTGGQAQQMSMIEALRKTLFGTPEEKKQAEEFNKQMQNNVITTKEYTDVMKDAFNPISIVDDIVGQVNTSLGKLKTTTAQTTETTDEATVSNEELAKASGVARMGIDQSATSIDAYVESVTKQIDAGDVLAKQQVDALAHIKPYTAEMLKLVDIENKGAQRIGELDKVQTQFNTTLQTTKSGVTTTVDIMKAMNDTLHVTSTNILNLDKEMNDLATKRAPEMAKAQQKAATDSQIAWKKFADEFNKNTDIISALGIDKKFDSDKIAKDLVKGLPNKLEKKMRLDLKFEEKSRKTEEGIQKFLQGVLDAKPTGGFQWDPDLKIDDKKAQDIAKDLIKNIDKNTKDPDLKQFRDKLKSAIDRGASDSEIADILAEHVKDAPPIPVYLVPDPNNPVGPAVQKELDKTTFPIAIEPQFDYRNDVPKPHNGKRFVATGPHSGKWIDINDMGYRSDHPGDRVHPEDETQPNWSSYFNPYRSNYGYNAYGTFDPNGGQVVKPQGKRGFMDVSLGRGTGTSGVTDPTVAAQQLQKSLANLANQGANSMRILGAAVKTNINSISNYAKGATVFLQGLQTGLANLAIQGGNSTKMLGTAAKTNFNSVSNYAKGATVFAQKLQTGLANLSNEGIKSEIALGKASKTQFNTVANFAKGAEKAAQKLQTGLANLDNEGVKSMKELAKSAKTNFNTVANYANGATQAVNKLSAAIRNIPSVPRGAGGGLGGRHAQHGMHETLGSDTLIMAHAGERVDIGHGSNNGGSGTVNQTIMLHISGNDIINERNLSKRIKLTVGENRDRFG